MHRITSIRYRIMTQPSVASCVLICSESAMIEALIFNWRSFAFIIAERFMVIIFHDLSVQQQMVHERGYPNG